ncbi:hypothetical protein A5692_25395 [Mycobacterium sp. E342]|nr:hypothetical protein A5692_25395 [Mycobacterium sp. E342]
MGTVYKAHDTIIGRDVAVKVLAGALGSEPGYVERFRREAHTVARLTEAHIIPVFDTGEVDGRLYLVMPLVDGVDLGALLQRDGPMLPERAVHVIEQLAAALDTAHTAGLVHRDIKPSNALVTPRDFVYLIDFGIARDTAAGALTSTGVVVGTMFYMAPERFTSDVADISSDIYSLACVLHECLTGRRPYPGEGMEQQIAGHLTVEPPRPSQQRPGLPPGFDEVIARGMAKNPQHRYPSAQELAAAARNALAAPPASERNAAPTMCGGSYPPPVWHDHGQPPAPTAPAQGAVQDLPTNSATRSRLRTATVVPTILLVLLLGAVVFAVTQFARPHPHPSTAPPDWQPYVDDAEQFAVIMTTFNPASIDSDVQRVLDGSVDEFHESFASNETVFKQAILDGKKATRGTVNAAGLESFQGTAASVLIAVTSTATGIDGSSEPPRNLRLRIQVRKVGDAYKVAKGEFV